jgi:hypothetical protein
MYVRPGLTRQFLRASQPIMKQVHRFRVALVDTLPPVVTQAEVTKGFNVPLVCTQLQPVDRRRVVLLDLAEVSTDTPVPRGRLVRPARATRAYREWVCRRHRPMRGQLLSAAPTEPAAPRGGWSQPELGRPKTGVTVTHRPGWYAHPHKPRRGRGCKNTGLGSNSSS